MCRVPRSRTVIFGTFALVASLVACAFGEPPSSHDQELGVPGVITGRHAVGYLDPLGEGCALCHGEDLKGGYGPTCFSCHGAAWDSALPQYPDQHTHVITGNHHTTQQANCQYCHDVFGDDDKKSFAHTPGHGTPFASGCTQCHGLNLDGENGIAHSCWWCHDTLWVGSGTPSGHTEEKGGYAMHKAGYQDPIANGCTQCHGPNLDDGFAPSCVGCHGPGGSGPPADHTEVKGGFAGHKPGFGDPVANECTQCHGPNLNDGFATSCLTCHGPAWEVTDGHHMPGQDDPWNNCTTCHGEDLQGGIAGVACVNCHNDFSPPDPPAPGHHFPGRETPVSSNCTMCHGSELGGNLGPSCLLCHEPLWESENLSPVPDAGGPYSGLIEEPVEFDASATFDPDGDSLEYQWDFGDGSAPTPPSDDPTSAHSYADAGDYTAVLTVTDSVNDPVMKEVVVEISDGTSPAQDRWSVTTTADPPEAFSIVFVNHSGALIATKDNGDNPASFSLGIEFPGVIFWMDVSNGVLWGTGDVFFGNINRVSGTMVGVVLEDAGGIATFTGASIP